MKEKLFMGVDYAYGSKKSNPFDISDSKKTLIEVRNGGMITPALNKIQSKINEGLKSLVEEIEKRIEEEKSAKPANKIEEVDERACIFAYKDSQQIISKYIKNG